MVLAAASKNALEFKGTSSRHRSELLQHRLQSWQMTLARQDGDRHCAGERVGRPGPAGTGARSAVERVLAAAIRMLRSAGIKHKMSGKSFHFVCFLCLVYNHDIADSGKAFRFLLSESYF